MRKEERGGREIMGWQNRGACYGCTHTSEVVQMSQVPEKVMGAGGGFCGLTNLVTNTCWPLMSRAAVWQQETQQHTMPKAQLI